MLKVLQKAKSKKNVNKYNFTIHTFSKQTQDLPSRMDGKDVEEAVAEGLLYYYYYYTGSGGRGAEYVEWTTVQICNEEED